MLQLITLFIKKISRQVELALSRYIQLVVQEEGQKQIKKSVKLDKYSGCRLSLETYLQIDNVILDNNLSLNLYIIFTICYIVVILDEKGEVEKRFLVRAQLEEYQGILSQILVNFQTEDYKVSTQSYILSL